jgi:chemotaxis protein methyltransferase CheR
VTDAPPLSREEFQQLCDYLYRRTGMVFTEAKRYYVERRVHERMSATASLTFPSYFARLRSNAQAELEHFINAFTVNETYFYREDHQLACLTNDLLVERTRSKKAGNSIRIWSVPCSTGEEPYSIALWLLENWQLVDDYEIEILGSDIDTQVLAHAQEAIFGKRALMRLSPHLVAKYFSPYQEDQWKILDELRDSVRFSVVNLVEPNDTRRQGRFDVIFCRNVLIYFDDASRRIAAENLFENLLPGGFICLGHTESMSRISPLFEVRRFSDAIVYQRPAGGGDHE